ncbi:MAG: GIY-YIG nuclease family protein [Bacteroidota bacterium]
MEKQEKFYVYILESETNGRWYYGFTTHLEQRLSDHQTNRSKYTRFKGPWRLVFQRAFSSKTQVLQFENHLKKTKNKAFIKQEYQQFFMESA